MSANMSTYDAILKEDYAPAIAENLSNRNILLKRFQKDSESIEGRQFHMPVHIARNETIASRGSGGTLPTTIGNQGYADAVYAPRYHFGMIEIDEIARAHSEKEKGAFVKTIESEVKGMTKDLGNDISRQLYGDGTGLLSACGTTTNAAIVQLDAKADMRKYRVNMRVDILVAANGTTGTGGTDRAITAVDKANRRITISGANVTTDGTYGVYRAGNRGLETNGLQNIVAATGAVGGLNPATAGQEIWAANVFGNSGTNRTISETLMQQAFDAPGEVGDGEVSLLVSSFGVRRAYANLLTSLKRFTTPMKLEGGFDALEFNGKPLVADKDCPYNTMYMLDEDHINILELMKSKWMDEDGTILKHNGGIGWKGIYEWFMNLGTDARNAHSVIQDITEA